MEGLKRLENEVLEMNDYNVSAIFDYLKNRKDLCDKFNNEEKSIKQMYEFICNKASKLKKNNVAMVADRVVYLWAVTYFSKSNKELGIKEKEKTPPTKIKTLEEEKAKIEQELEKKKEEEKQDNQISMFGEVQK